MREKLSQLTSCVKSARTECSSLTIRSFSELSYSPSDACLYFILVYCTDIYLLLKEPSAIEGNSKLQIGIDYYNRTLSGWEPLLEQWR